MRAFALSGVLGLVAFTGTCVTSDAASIAGTVKGPDGAPFRGAFVQARHAGLKMTVSVLTDNEGRYLADNLPAGDYRVQVRAIGYKADAQTGVKLAGDQSASFDFALTPGLVRWSDISIYQGKELLPDARGKKPLFENCVSCHGFQSKMAATIRDEDGWRDRVTFMREAMRSSLADRQGFSDQQAEDVVSYLTTMFGENSLLPKSPADLPGYKATLTQFSDEALKIVYVDFEMPGPTASRGPPIPTRTAISGFPNMGRPTRLPGSSPRPARSRNSPRPIWARR